MQMTIKIFMGIPCYSPLHSITPSPTKGYYIPVTVIVVYVAIYHGRIDTSFFYN